MFVCLSCVNCHFRVNGTEVPERWHLAFQDLLKEAAFSVTHVFSPLPSMISAEFIFFNLFSHSHTHLLTTSPAVNESDGQEDIREVLLELNLKDCQDLVGEKRGKYFLGLSFHSTSKGRTGIAGVSPSQGAPCL